MYTYMLIWLLPSQTANEALHRRITNTHMTPARRTQGRRRRNWALSDVTLQCPPGFPTTQVVLSNSQVKTRVTEVL